MECEGINYLELVCQFTLICGLCEVVGLALAWNTLNLCQHFEINLYNVSHHHLTLFFLCFSLDKTLDSYYNLLFRSIFVLFLAFKSNFGVIFHSIGSYMQVKQDVFLIFNDHNFILAIVTAVEQPFYARILFFFF